MSDATNPWIDMARVAIAPTLNDDNLKVRGQGKIDDDEGEGPRPKAARARFNLGEPVSKVTLQVRRWRAKRKALTDP